MFPQIMILNYENVINPRIRHSIKHPIEKLFAYNHEEYNNIMNETFIPTQNDEYEPFKKHHRGNCIGDTNGN